MWGPLPSEYGLHWPQGSISVHREVAPCLLRAPLFFFPLPQRLIFLLPFHLDLHATSFNSTDNHRIYSHNRTVSVFHCSSIYRFILSVLSVRDCFETLLSNQHPSSTPPLTFFSLSLSRPLSSPSSCLRPSVELLESSDLVRANQELDLQFLQGHH